MFNTNNEYARRYDEWRRKEELSKLKDKYGDGDEDESSSSSESEDDPLLTNPKLQEDWLKTLEALKNKDPKIYQKDYHFFTEPNGEDEDSDSEPKLEKKKERPMYLKDYERKVILEKGGIISSDEEDFQPEDVKTYNQEQEELRQEFVHAAADADNDSDNDDGFGGGLFVKRKRTVDEIQAEEKEQEEWMKEHKASTKKMRREEIGVEAEPLSTHDISSIEDRQEFLKNYILQQSYLEKDKSRIPTYDEVVHREHKPEEEDKHNFRSEESGSTEVKTFPRGNKHLIRQKDNKRAEKRTAMKERKRLEKDKKKEELKRLKNLKRQEILAKIEKLKEVTGNDSLGFNEDDIEGDFDPDQYDQMMEKQFNDDYYAVGTEDVEKPVFEMSDEEDYGENLDEWTGGNNPDNAGDNYNEDGPHVDDPDFCMDADYDASAPKPLSRKKMKRLRNKKNKHKLIDLLEQEKPMFNPDEKSFDEYLDDYYNLDFEDIIDDIPCRFKYRKVTPYAYGLTEEEILNSDEKELDAWVKLKRINKYRSEAGDKQHIEGFEKQAKNKKLKKRVLISLYQPSEEKEKTDEKEEGKSKKRKRKKGKKFKRDRQGANTGNLEIEVYQSTSSIPDQSTEMQAENSGKKKKKSKKKDEAKSLENSEKQSVQQSSDPDKNKNIDGDKKSGSSKKKHHKQTNISEERLKAYGLDAKTIKYAKEGRFSYKYKQKK